MTATMSPLCFPPSDSDTASAVDQFASLNLNQFSNHQMSYAMLSTAAATTTTSTSNILVITALPVEVLLSIIDELDIASLFALAQVS